MMKKLFQLIMDVVFGDDEPRSLDHWIASHNPSTPEEVDLLVRQYQARRASVSSYERYY